MISLDTETTGVDLYHAARPFFVTVCHENDEQEWWEWEVNPLTRQPKIPPADVVAIRELLKRQGSWAKFDPETAERHAMVLQNAKFDVTALASIGINDWPWGITRDTLIAGHLLGTNLKHDLTSMCVQYLGVDIEPYEVALEEACREARSIARRQLPEWRIAKEGMDGAPSVKASASGEKDKCWKNDMWLPRALVLHWQKVGDPRARQMMPNGKSTTDHPWLTVLRDYSNADSWSTLKLWRKMYQELQKKGLWKIFLQHMHLPRVANEMQANGVTVIGDYTEKTIGDYQAYIKDAEDELACMALGYGHELKLAKGASINTNMREFFYECLQLPPVYNAKSKGPSLDKDVMQHYLATTEDTPHDFLKLLLDKRKRDTDLQYMEGYCRYWLPMYLDGCEGEGYKIPGFYRIHPNLNPVGTDHLRWSSNGPNLQNVGKQEDECEHCEGVGCPRCKGTGKSRLSVKRCFGPGPGREWWTMDYEQIERRIPPYECKEEKMVAVFEKPNTPPYWGNLYYLTASVLYPNEFFPRSEEKLRFKKECPRLYKQAKFFDLAKQYGAGRNKGDTLSKVKNSYDLIDNNFPKLARLQAHYLSTAKKLGYVETIPDKNVDPTKGYPILASRTEDGYVLSTTPFNYHISGTACWCKNKALVRCSSQLARWRLGQNGDRFDGRMILEIHDELLFDFPRGKTMEDNLPRALVLKYLMEKSGEDIGIPCPVSVEFHSNNYAEGVTV